MAFVLFAVAMVAACSGSSSGPTSSATSPTALTGQPTHAIIATATPGLTPIGTGGAIDGNSGNICSAAPSGSKPLPASIPAYPNGDLRVRPQSDGSGFYGICTADPVTTVGNFYTSQLPDHGWGQINSSAIGGVDLISATQGSASVSIAIRPEPSGGKTDIVIQTNGM